MNENELSVNLNETIMSDLESDSPIYGIESEEQYQVPVVDKPRRKRSVVLTNSENLEGREVLTEKFEENFLKVLSKIDKKKPSKSVSTKKPSKSVSTKKPSKSVSTKKPSKSTQKSKKTKSNSKAPVKAKSPKSTGKTTKKGEKSMNVTSKTARFIWSEKDNTHFTYIQYDGEWKQVYKNKDHRDYRFLVEGYKAMGKKLVEAGIDSIEVTLKDDKTFTYEKGSDPILPKVSKSPKETVKKEKTKKTTVSVKKSQKSENSQKKSKKTGNSQKKSQKSFKSYSVNMFGHGFLEGTVRKGTVVAKEGKRLIVETFNKKINMKVRKTFSATTGKQLDGQENYYYSIEV